MFCFNFDLIEKTLLEENKKRKIVSATLYLQGDEFWNSTTIIENNKFTKKKWIFCYGGSYWAVPMLEIKYLIENEEFIKLFDVSKQVDKGDFDADCVEAWLQNTKIYEKLGLELAVEDE